MMKTKNIIVLASSMIFLSALISWMVWPSDDSSDQNDVTIQEKNEPDENIVLAVLNSACPVLTNKYQSDIKQLSVEFREQCSTWDCLNYEWNTSYMITVTISDNPISIPKRLRLAGHTIKFEIGNGKRAGVAMSKGARLCGHENLQTESGSNIIVDVDLAETLDYKTPKY